MKRIVAKRRLKYGCDQCSKSILKGRVYYRKRTVLAEENKVYGYTVIFCAKCKYKADKAHLRFIDFQNRCTHPEEFRVTEYTRERCPSPDYDYCRLCLLQVR